MEQHSIIRSCYVPAGVGENQLFNREGEGSDILQVFCGSCSQVPQKETQDPQALSARVLSNLDSLHLQAWGEDVGPRNWEKMSDSGLDWGQARRPESKAHFSTPAEPW